MFTVKLPVGVIAALRREVRSSGQTLSATVAEAVRCYLDHERHGGKAR